MTSALQSLRRTWAIAAVLVLLPLATAVACPFCGVAPQPLSERLAKSDIVVLVSWLDTSPAKGDDEAATRFEVLANATNSKLKLGFKKGEKLTLPREYFANRGDAHLLFGSKMDELRWTAPLFASEAVYRYLLKAPAFEKPTRERLPYFLDHLESADPVIALDAFSEFALAPFEDVRPLADKFPRDKLRNWLTSGKKHMANRLGLYGLMLGLCGDKSDAELLQAKIAEPVTDYPLGRDGMIFGYLFLTRTDGLNWIDDAILKLDTATVNDVTAAMQALEVLWTNGQDRVPPERLRASMRLTLKRVEVAERAVANLARWEDWSVQDRLMELYDHDEDQGPRLRQAIIHFLLTAANAPTRKSGTDPNMPLPAWALQARKNLDKLRQRDPKLVKDVERKFE